mgnify:CR=1 FL=1
MRTQRRKAVEHGKHSHRPGYNGSARESVSHRGAERRQRHFEHGSAARQPAVRVGSEASKSYANRYQTDFKPNMQKAQQLIEEIASALNKTASQMREQDAAIASGFGA